MKPDTATRHHGYGIRAELRPNGSVLEITLDRPQKANAYTKQMLVELTRTLDTASADDRISALVITGAGERVFCAGADLIELAEHRFEDAYTLTSRHLFDRLARSPWPVVAAVNGAAVGGGLELALACDLRVCSPNARFFLPEIDHGLIPAAGGLRRLPRLIGPARATEMILFGREIDAATALDWGLVNHIAVDCRAHAIAMAEAVTRRNPTAVRLAKRILSAQEQADGRALEASVQAHLYERRWHHERGERD